MSTPGFCRRRAAETCPRKLTTLRSLSRRPAGLQRHQNSTKGTGGNMTRPRAAVFPLPRQAIVWEPGARRRKQVLPGAKSDRRIGLLRALMSALFAQQPGIPEPPGSPPRPPADPTAPPPREDPPRPIPIPRPDEPPGIDDPPPNRNSSISSDLRHQQIERGRSLGASGAAGFEFLPEAVLALLPRGCTTGEQPAKWRCYSFRCPIPIVLAIFPHAAAGVWAPALIIALIILIVVARSRRTASASVSDQSPHTV